LSRDRILGLAIVVASVAIVVVYNYVLFATSYYLQLLKLTGAIAVTAIFGVLAWIGYTLATTPPPKPIEEIEREIEEELKKLKTEEKKGEGSA